MPQPPLRSFVALGVICLVVAPAAFARGAPGGAIIATGSKLRLGAWQIEPYRNGRPASYGDAVAAFGAPDRCSVVARGGIQGVARWKTLGITLYAATLGYAGPGKTACNDPGDWQVDHVVVGGRSFKTARGLRVGDTVAKLHHLYPTASYHSGFDAGVWLVSVTRRCTLGDCTGTPTVTVPRLIARVAHGRVSSFLLPVGSQGE